ncbi:MAG: 2-succinyl-5-enolpyruvyl-6-hydroxy-3-cyclohexene-1-carboxylate synthase, partial [Phocaeicola sp.]|nr:2-succinyl-5-enolpyruvyl-6-hydroxy-3-cyclohexene-1-carboxylate synthase [Phocaeicola sp.]
HYTTAKGWAEERGFIYIKVTDEEELEVAMEQFAKSETQMQPMLMEVFTDKEKDTSLLRSYYHGLKNKNG